VQDSESEVLKQGVCGKTRSKCFSKIFISYKYYQVQQNQPFI